MSARLALLATLLAATPLAAVELEFTRLNRTYDNLVAVAPPYESGPLRVEMRSPEQKVTLRGHRLRLTRLDDGSWRAELEADFLGKGWLVADVAVGALSRRLEDELILPPQKLALAGRVKLARAADGYRFIALELPAKAAIELRSRLGVQVINLCDRASLLTLGALDCTGVDRGLSRVEVPLPPAGSEFFLAESELADADRAALDALLAAP